MENRLNKYISQHTQANQEQQKVLKKMKSIYPQNPHHRSQTKREIAPLGPEKSNKLQTFGTARMQVPRLQ
jgi:hypothetical protein